MKNNKKVFFSLILFVFILSACSKKEDKATVDRAKDPINSTTDLEETSSTDKKTIYVTSFPLYDFTKSIVGDKMEVVNMTGNQGFHGWEPTAKDIAKVQEADMFVYSGPGLEKWVDNLIENGTISGNIVAGSQGLDLLMASHVHQEDYSHEEDHHNEDHSHGNFDPHIWLSLRNAQIILSNIKDGLVELDSANKDFYENNYKLRAEAFQSLDEKYSELLENPLRDMILVSHEAYAYLARDYKFKQVGIQGINADGEPSLKQINSIIDLAKENDLKVIFYEHSTSPKVPTLIAEEVGASLEFLSPLEALTKEQIEAGKDYLAVMEDNLEVINKALNE
ncbi:MAG: zinc ABC transporter substrate-binding protein [Bacillota bacterium]|nr:zinc ABC transporter substrate-binding protein [Bacillota bacterium]